MKDGKLSIDFIIIFAFIICLAALSMDIYSSYLEYFTQKRLANVYLNNILIKVYSKAPVFQYSIFTRFICILLFAFASLGFHVKKKPEGNHQIKYYITGAVIGILGFIFIAAIPALYFLT